jgi:hypothetical protein
MKEKQRGLERNRKTYWAGQIWDLQDGIYIKI